MARLTTSARKSLPKKDFALPKSAGSGKAGKGSYPIENKAHARNALSRVSQFGTPAEKSKVRAKVHAKFPDIGKSKGEGAQEHSHEGILAMGHNGGKWK